METTPVNWESLDSLVFDFAKSENLVEEVPVPNSSVSSSSIQQSNSLSSLSPSSPCISSSSYHARLIIRQIRRCIEQGDLDSATEFLRSHAPFLLEDSRIFFRLQKQKFVELLRQGTSEARNAAIDCIRKVLAPCALDAYPEAYEEFKHVLLAFIYDKNDSNSPVADEWAEKRRFEIAGLISSVLRAHLHVYDPVFSMTLRYLISIHKNYCLREGLSSPISNLTERLLLEERDPPAVPHESLYEVPPFDEFDIQALAHAVELTRQGAIDSLRFVKGDLFQAFQNELSRMKLDINMLDELVREYCVYRGIVDSGFAFSDGTQTTTEPQNPDQQDVGSASSKSLLSEDNFALKNASRCEPSRSISASSPESYYETCSNQRTGFDHRCNEESAVEACSTSVPLRSVAEKCLIRNKKYLSAERSKRKRWRGRLEDDDYPVSNFPAAVDSNHDPSTYAAEKMHFSSEISKEDNRYEIALAVKELTSKGMTAEVVDEINSFDPNFFAHNRSFLFHLKKIEFLKLVTAGDQSAALKVACTHLGPLAASDPDLLQPLKETLLELLLPTHTALRKELQLPLHSLASSLQVAVGRSLGIEEPQLMKIMRATLYTHSEWFKLQMCKDRFESVLRIDSLKEVQSPSACPSKSNGDSCTQGSSQITDLASGRGLEDGNSPHLAPSGDFAFDENAILKVMEFLALPRADAIHLLAQYNGNAETVIQQLFA